MSVKRGTPDWLSLCGNSVGKLVWAGVFARPNGNLTVRSDCSVVPAFPADTTGTMTDTMPVFGVGSGSQTAPRSDVRRAMNNAAHTRVSRVVRRVVVGASLPVVLVGFGAGTFLRTADGSDAEGGHSSIERSMATVGMASQDEVRTNGLESLVLRDGPTQATRAANPLYPRTKSKVEPVVLGAAMEVAIALPRE